MIHNSCSALVLCIDKVFLRIDEVQGGTATELGEEDLFFKTA